MAGKRGKRRQDCWSSEVTVYDFADSSRPSGSGRLKKGAANSTKAEVKKLSGVPEASSRMNQEEEETSWFDKDLDDFDVPIKDDNDEFADEDADLLESESTTEGRRGRGKQRHQSGPEKTGRRYPIDLWYLVSRHIDPEAVSKFAILCRDAYDTTRTCAFWRNLYRRFYSKEKELPKDLRLPFLERNHGLRARCIRALFILSPTLSERPHIKGPYEADPHSLIGYRCLLMWYQPVRSRWHFCYKLKKPLTLPQESNTRPACADDVRTGYNNLFYNPEEGCCVLQVHSTHFLGATPHQVMGMLLTGVHVSLSHGFRHQRIRLGFDSTVSDSTNHAVECVLDPVTSIRIIHWWDPAYHFAT